VAPVRDGVKCCPFFSQPPLSCVLHADHTPALTTKEKKATPHRPRALKSENAAVSQYRKTLVEAARDWSSSQHAMAKSETKRMLKKAEYSSTKSMVVVSKGWAHKHSLPSVQFHRGIKLHLIDCFNKKPHMSPDQALHSLKGLPQYANDVFVEYFVTATRIKGYFSRLKKHRDTNLKAEDDVPRSVAGEETSKDEYKDLKQKDDLKAEIIRRNILVDRFGSLKKSQLVDVLLQHDKEHGDAEDAIDVEEDFMVEEAIREDESGGLNDTESPQELYNASTGILESEIPDSDDDGIMEENVASMLLD